MKIDLGRIVALVCLALSSARADGPPGEIVLPIETFRAGVVDVVLQPDPQAFSVTVHTWYAMGSDDDARGIPATIGRLMFRGSKHLPDGRYEQLIDAAGGWTNASVASDHVSCVAHVPATALALVLQLEAERMVGLDEAFDQRRLDNVRGQLRTERTDQAADLAIRAALYPGRPEPLGENAALDHVTVADLRAFWRDHVRSGATLLVIAGRFDPKIAREEVQRLFGWMADRPRRAVTPRPAQHPLAARVELAVQADVPGTKLVVAFRTDEPLSVTSADLATAARILGEGKSSRLHHRLVDTLHIATDVRVDVVAARGGGVFMIEALLAQGADPQRARTEIFDELAALRTNAVSDDELARATTMIESLRIEALENLAFRAESLARWTAWTGTPANFTTLRRTTTREALRATAVIWLADQAAVIAVIKPRAP